MSAPLNGGISIHVNGTAIDLPTVPQCHCCGSAWHERINAEVIEGRTYASIADGLPEGSGITSRNVADHARNHVPLKSAAIEAVRAIQAEQRGSAYQPVGEAVVGRLDLARRVVGRVAERLEAGEIEPSVRDGLNAETLLVRFGTDEADPRTIENLSEAIGIMLRTVRESMSSENYRALSTRLYGDERLRRLIAGEGSQ